MQNINKRELFLRHVAQTSEMPMEIEIERAEGIYQYGTDGKRYIDFISGISVSNLGHHHPKIIEAIKKQLDKHSYIMVYGEFIQNPQVELANALSKILPQKLDNVFFVNSGSEAVEGALKLAKRYTRRSEIIAFNNAYHGSSHGSISLISDKEYTRKFRPLLPDIKHLEFNDLTLLDQISNRTACVIIEPVQGEGGINIPGATYIQELRKKCTETGTLLIFDEIQTGMGRTGKMFAFEHFGVIPDILLLAKAFGGGMPLGAFIASQEIMHSLTNNPILGHISTFGGHPISCAAGLAALEILQSDKIVEEVEAKGRLLESLLMHDKIKEIRRMGLLLAVDFGDFDLVLKIIHKATEKGLILDWFLWNEESIRISPPLIITEQEIKKAAKIFMEILDTILY